MWSNAQSSSETTKHSFKMAPPSESLESTSDPSGSTNSPGSKVVPNVPTTVKKPRRSEQRAAAKIRRAPVFRHAIALGLIVGCVGSLGSAYMWKSNPERGVRDDSNRRAAARGGASNPGEILIPFDLTPFFAISILVGLLNEVSLFTGHGSYRRNTVCTR